MGKLTVLQVGNIKVKMDTKDTLSYDAKEPHVSFEENGRVTIPHILLSDVDNLVGRTSDEKEAIYKLRRMKPDLIKLFYEKNR